MAASVGNRRRLTAVGWVLSNLARHAWVVEDEVVGLADWVKLGDVCIDIGAEHGLYTAALAARVGPTGQMHSIEPQPHAGRVRDLAVRLAGAKHIVTTYRLARPRISPSSGLARPMCWPSCRI